MKKDLLDTNIVLDIALKRDSFYDESFHIFSLINKKKIKAYITTTSITDIYYIIKKELNHNLSIQFIEDLVSIVCLINVTEKTVLSAIETKNNDFEDAIQFIAAHENSLNLIITRDKKGFLNSELKVLNPTEFLNTY